MMPQRESRRPQPHNQNLVPGLGQRQGLFEIKRVPARQQAVNLESPGQGQNVLDDTGFHLGNFHRLLFLEDAGLGTLVADTMPGTRHQGIVHGNDGQGSQGIAVDLDLMHLGNALV